MATSISLPTQPSRLSATPPSSPPSPSPNGSRARNGGHAQRSGGSLKPSQQPAILRKDFIVDIYQVMEAHLQGADTVLPTVAMFTDAQLKELYNFSRFLGTEPLVENNNGWEMKRLSARGSCRRRAGGRDEGHTHQDQGAAWTGREEGGIPTDAHIRRTTLVKLCGIQTLEAAVEATQAGADFIGIIFAKSRCQVHLDRTAQIIEAVRALNTVSAYSAVSAPALP
ncbi:indole-3-glycerol phosphate synthase-domain-containing protein [Jimgerdemannia flammicorona]|uniref:indole-3-glycerol-phosphate synthase n=1 Tax=Jimgerdemannia flammicorona TaxID=994334 RepID=A0A433D774_9FUNG|nr:indole-3-glycerol phosphate synthase-domain-containing protein [Jimgerdemannia flammicorona]